jgi:hypothetical protein
MAKEDKIGLTLIIALLCGLLFGAMKIVQIIGRRFFNAFQAGADGIGYSTAFIAGVIISFLIIIVLALVSGGGELLGELPFVILGFFIFVVFFTLSIAILF